MEISKKAMEQLRKLGDFVKSHPLYSDDWLQHEIWLGSQEKICKELEEALQDSEEGEYMIYISNHYWDNHKKVYCEPWFTIRQSKELEEDGEYQWFTTDEEDIKLSSLYI